MCELYFLKRMGSKDNVDGYDISQFLKMMKDGGTVNSDGFGLTNGSGIFKKPVKLEGDMFSDIISRFNRSGFLLGHTRFATSGTVKKGNSHPFYNKRFIWVHNGIIDNYKHVAEAYKLVDIRVDSQVIGDLLYLKSGDSAEVNISKVICDMMGELSGSFSVFIYDYVTEKLYYFKSGCYFYFELVHVVSGKHEYDVVAGCTDLEKISLMYNKLVMKKYGFSVGNGQCLGYINPEDDVLYEFTDSGLVDVGKFSIKPSPTKHYTYYNDSLDSWDNSYGYGYGTYKDKGIVSPSLSNDCKMNQMRENISNNWSIKDMENFLFSYFDSSISIFKSSGGSKMYRMESSDEYTLDDIFSMTNIDAHGVLSWCDLVEICNVLYSMSDLSDDGDDNIYEK